MDYAITILVIALALVLFFSVTGRVYQGRHITWKSFVTATVGDSSGPAQKGAGLPGSVRNPILGNVPRVPRLTQCSSVATRNSECAP